MRESHQAGAAAEYAPRHPETTALYGVVQHHLETWLTNVRDQERTVPRFVERELRAFLDCGILANGFLRVHCDECGLDRVVPFSCKGRGFCPSCGGRHMADTAAHLVDRTLPRVPVRQWVLSLPFGLRYRLAYDRELTAKVLRVLIRAVFASLRRRTRPMRATARTGRAHGGAVSFVESEDDGELRFHPAPPPESEELDRVLQRVIRGTARILERRGLGDEPDRLGEDDPLLAQLLAASVQGRTATGPRAGQKLLRFGDRVELAADANVTQPKTSGVARTNGFSLHAGVAVPANDRQRLERLCRYVGRPPVATQRLSKMGDGRLLYELRHRWRDGTTHVAFEPLELIDRLAALVPPPRFHTVRYHGVLASRSKHRADVVPSHSDQSDSCTPSHSDDSGKSTTPKTAQAQPDTERTSRPSRYYSWPELMRRVFEIDVLECPRCKAKPMRILAAIHPPSTTEAILKSLGLPTRAPPISPAQPVSEDWTLAEPRPKRHPESYVDLPAD